MGCDIHVVLETKRTEGISSPKWIGTNAYNVIPSLGISCDDTETWFYWRIAGRNYGFFSQLAGVRGEGPKPRGLPEDVSDMALWLSDSWGYDGHSHSWGTLEEIGGLIVAHYLPDFIMESHAARTEALLDFLGVVNYRAIDDLPKVLANHRLVYWFDN
jgi:hypothetical protein